MSWSGVKQQSIKADIEAWCEEMNMRNYTINSQGEIDVRGNVMLQNNLFSELPYKFGKVMGIFVLDNCENLISLKNCPHSAFGFSCSRCSQLDSLEGCPKEVGGDFWCDDCKRKFTKEEVKSLCKVKGVITYTLRPLPKINFNLSNFNSNIILM